jgi:hypothetical protein
VTDAALGPGDQDSLLLAALRDLIGGDRAGAFVLLRETALDASCIDRGDVDLLGTRTAVAALIRRAMGLVQDGRCHVRARRTSADKAQLELFSLDLEHRIVLDLWEEVWQIDGGKLCLRFEDISPHARPQDGALLRMPPDLEASVYVHHLATKLKDLSSDALQARLAQYAAACAAAGHPEFAAGLADLRSQVSVPAELLDRTCESLRQATDERPWRRPEAARRRELARWWSTTWLVPRGAPLVAIVGCDGAGKTTLAQTLAEADSGRFSTRVGKDLYRDWLPFRLFYRVGERIIGFSREQIDERLVPLAYGLAWLSLWFLQLGRRSRSDTGLVLMDRALVDFLYVKRKSDRPRFSRATSLLAPLGVGVSALHLIVPHEILDVRKGEMTARGHSAYDADMFDLYTQGRAFDYLALANASALEPAARALRVFLVREYVGSHSSDPAAPHALQS